MRSKRSKAIAAIVLGVIVVVVIANHLLNRQPSYQGRQLSDWLDSYAMADENSLEEAEAAAAVRAIGTNALPTLLKWIQSEPGWSGWLHYHLPSTITDKKPIERWFDGPRRHVRYAYFGFWILGTNAAIAIPALQSMMRDASRETIANNAIGVLGNIGEPALPVLKAALADTNYFARPQIIWEFHSMVCATKETNTYLPLILEAFNHENADVRESATNAFSYLQQHFFTNTAAN